MNFWLLLLLLVVNTEGFVPHDLIKKSIYVSNNFLENTLGVVSESFTHEEILKRGLIRSVAKYFYDVLPDGRQRIDLTRVEGDYQNIKRLYNDVYDMWYCKIEFEDLVENVFLRMVVNVDLHEGTKDYPAAHFDAEKFHLSNDRVEEYKNKIFEALARKDTYGYRAAASFAGNILHTIHDFYSHSNWVELGNREINPHIGKPSFHTLPFADKDEITCYDNCVVVRKDCGSVAGIISKVIETLQCPLVYYNCTNNLPKTKKLISGFYVNQRLQDGTEINKPVNKGKCSHGGSQDKTSHQSPKGGINKDSGLLVLSPHAHLHQEAARLAIQHTEMFFNEIRFKIGNEEFANFLRLHKPEGGKRNKFNQYVQFCSGCQQTASTSTLIICIVYLIAIIYFQ